MLFEKIERILPLVQKPGRYTGGEVNSVMKDADKVDVRFAFCFPDIYEIGMSHLGMKILYGMLNDRDDCWCERVFAPDKDMEEQMRLNNIPLFSIESTTALDEFDIIGFTLQYELCYTNVLNMLQLGNIPLRAKDRTSLKNIVVAGGPCVCNPEPIADFFDVFFIGEGEELDGEFVELYKQHKKMGSDKQTFLRAAAKIQGVYVPEFYNVEYNDDMTVKCVTPKYDDVPAKVVKRVVRNLDNSYYPEKLVVPFIDVVHDRAIAEIFRGCIRGCRFCQAGYIYRPIREKSPQVILEQVKKLCDTSGYEEVSLLSLSTSDYSGLSCLLPELINYTKAHSINLSLPSLRVDNFSKELSEQLQTVRRSGLTFAPEAGTQRMRDVINKNITQQDVLKTAEMAFEGGWTSMKLYFMLGLPTETMEDIEGIANLAQSVVDAYYNSEFRQKGKAPSVSISVAAFIPKPFTPFQWEPQDTLEMFEEKQKHLMSSVRSKKISVSYHDAKTSVIEGVFARGDRRLSDVIENAFLSGCKFDSWDDSFSYEKWMQAFENCGVDYKFYVNRMRDYSEVFPWSHLDYGVREQLLIKENELAHQAQTTPNCREKCSACGANKLNGGECCAIG
ncbi:MAG: TIGR03960 family B12-binding radical SAM protein [Clostridia bacterium]|nr:TIGR03960 family B12-binding radical SAM protein [Clostridia bacterium]